MTHTQCIARWRSTALQQNFIQVWYFCHNPEFYVLIWWICSCKYQLGYPYSLLSFFPFRDKGQTAVDVWARDLQQFSEQWINKVLFQVTECSGWSSIQSNLFEKMIQQSMKLRILFNSFHPAKSSLNHIAPLVLSGPSSNSSTDYFSLGSIQNQSPRDACDSPRCAFVSDSDFSGEERQWRVSQNLMCFTKRNFDDWAFPIMFQQRKTQLKCPLRLTQGNDGNMFTQA